jgi:membrane protease YdiL (CAAX protease family)
MLVIIAITTLLVGFSEEAMFRGVLLHNAIKKYGTIKAVFISSLGFSLLHSINIFGGQSISATLIQMAFTFVLGLFFSLVAIRVKNIVPLIIFHFLWDFTLLSADYLGIATTLLSLNTLYELVVIIILFIVLIRSKRT